MTHTTPKDCLIHCTDDTVTTVRDIMSLLVADEIREYYPVDWIPSSS